MANYADALAVEQENNAAAKVPPAGTASVNAASSGQWLDPSRQAMFDDIENDNSQPLAEEPTWRGLARNAAAGVVENAEGALNALADPSGTLGRGLAYAGILGHDVVAPYFGGKPFTPQERADLIGDGSYQESGTRLGTSIAGAIGAPTPDQIKPKGTAESVARDMAGMATGAAIMGPGASVGGVIRDAAAGAGGAVGQHVADAVVPEDSKYRPLADLVGAAAPGAVLLAPKVLMREGGPEAETAKGAAGDAEPSAQGKPSPLKLGLFSSPKDADKLGAQLLAEFAHGGPTDVTQSQIPGVRLTMAQATGNPNIALLERVRRAENPNAFLAQDQQNAAARNAYAQEQIGTPEQLEAAVARREAAESALRPKIFENQQPVDTSPVVAHLQSLIDANKGRPTIQAPLQNVMDQIKSVADENGRATPDNLWNLRKYLGDMIAPRATGTANDGQAAAAQLMDLKPVLTDQIENGAPGFKGYLSQYEQMSRPIDSMGYLQARNLTDAQGNIQLGRLDSFLKAIQRDQGKPGYRPADSVTDDQIRALTALRDDMNLDHRIDLGKARGSDTNVNLTTSGRLADLTQGKLAQVAGPAAGGLSGLMTSGLGGGTVGAMVGRAAAGAVSQHIANRLAETHQAIMEALDRRLLNPYDE